jgi:anti-sigma factor RsiW
MNPHTDVGAYLLGALDDAEMDAFEEHLAECDACGRELDELSGLVPVLEELRMDGLADGAVAVAGPPSGDALLDRLLRQVAGERRSRGRRRLVAVAAAAALAVGGPAITVVATQGGGSGSRAAPQSIAVPQHSASNPATGASAVVGVTDKGWGSAVDIKLTGVRGPLTCSLVAVGRDGTRQTVATWSVPDAGYGTPLTVHGAAGLHSGSISRFDVRTAQGTLLVSVPK